MSRPPWLHALTLWPHGTTYGGGGRFIGERTVALRRAGAAHPDHPAVGLTVASGPCPVHASDGAIEGADWSGRDQRRRHVFTRGGKLLQRLAGGSDRELADFDGLQPEPREASEWARRRLGRAG